MKSHFKLKQPKPREIPTDLGIRLYFHCRKCLECLPENMAPQEWAQLEIGFSDLGVQVWCRRHECNVVHIDFQGQQHPAAMGS